MATKKKLLQAAAGTAAAGGAGALNVEDVFSTYLYEGNEGVNAIENGINLGQSNDGGSAKFSGASTSSYIEVPNSTDFTLGSYYSLEANIWLETTTGSQTIFGRWYATNNNENYVFYVGSGGTVTGGVYPAYSQLQSVTGLQSGRWYHLLFSFDGSSLRLFIDGTLDQTVSSNQHYVTGTGSTPFSIGGNSDGGANFKGNISNVRVRKFTQSSQVPTSNFTAPTSPLTADAYTVLLTCQGDDAFTDNSASSHTVSAVSSSDVTQSTFGPFDAAEAGEGGMAWVKARTNGTYDHYIMDTERGVLKYLKPNGTSAEASSSNAITSFNSEGFTIGGGGQLNNGGDDYASWTFRKAPKFFDVVTYTGNGTAGRTISHNLGTTVGSIFVKRTDSAANWMVYHRGNTSAPHTDFLKLNLTDATQDAVSIWNDTAPTSTEFTVGSSNDVNASGGTYVAYLFAHNDGDGDFGPTGDQDIIKCGSFTGNGSSTGPEIDLGFEPQWILLKDATNGNTNWNMHDNMRGISVGGADAILYANQNFAENASTARMDITSTGFKMTTSTTGWNASSANMIYIAIRRGPMAVPTAGTDVFDVNTYSNNGNSNIYDTGFNADMNINTRHTATENNYIIDRLRGGSYLKTNDSGVDVSTAVTFWDDGNNILDLATSWWSTTSGVASWSWKRAPSFCDVVAYTGNGVRGHTINHNLGVAPEMIWVKNRDQPDFWVVYHSALGNDTKLILNDTSATSASDFGWWAKTDPTDQVFSVGESGRVNGSGENLIAYLFASLDGVSKVGSYTGNGSTQNIDCGFSSGARFVLIKCSSHSLTDWHVMDSTRGIVAGNDPFLYLNSNSAEDTGEDIIDPYSSGFALPANNRVNTSGRTYIFYAIA